MPKIRVLIVDDAVVVRKMLSDTMNEDPEIEVVGVAANGSICLQKIPQVNPDVISLDIEMPGMDGLEALDKIREKWPKLPVIMFSTLTQKGAVATLDALSKGATDYVAKPSKAKSLDEGIELIKNGLIPKIKAICSERAGLNIPVNLPNPKPQIKHPEDPKKMKGVKRFHRVDVVTIGVSTGGPNALAEVLPTFPENFPVPIVLVQHMPPNFTKLLADRLDSKSNLKIKECENGDVLQPGHVYIAPGDYHMVVEQDKGDVVARTNQAPHENSCRPAADVLFRSVAKTFGRNALAVILTGMGQDGMQGCQHIQARGGQVIAQDEASSVVWGMPGFVVKSKLADAILPLNKVADEIIIKCQTGRLTSLISGTREIK
jgi:two-component system chemotaxis response regulator CheB